MTVLIDPPLWHWRDERWSHLVSDESYEELHALAEAMGIPRRAFQGDHYDVPERYRSLAIEHGAVEVSTRELVQRLVASGLRRRRSRATELRLRPVRVEDEPVVLAAHETMAAEDFVFALAYEPDDSFGAYVDRLDRIERGEPPMGRYVESSFLLAEVGGRVVGRSSIRHRLNDVLLREGGHVGYCVLPPFRRRGYASEILRQSLERLRALGVDPVLVTCDDDNVGSATVIERAGGVLEDVVDGESGGRTRRYWISAPTP